MTARLPLVVLALAVLAGCAAGPPPARPAGLPAPTPAPTATPALSPREAPAPAMSDVAEPRLDVGLSLDRPSFALPEGEWLLRSADRTALRRGPIVVTPAAAAALAAVPAPLFVVQAGAFGTRAVAETEAARLAALALPAEVAEAAGRTTVRVGPPLVRSEAEALLARVRRQGVPDAFLVGATPGPAVAVAAPRLVVQSARGSEDWGSPLEIAAPDDRALPSGDGRYRGHLVLRATGRGTLHVVNRVRVEDYLRGVVPAEMGPKVYDELEALKAQTVAARSYALRRRGEYAAEGFDLCATPRCQVYGGAGVEQTLTDRAVEETAGEVLSWGGRVADALFTSTCGGRTEDAATVFPSYGSVDAPYLSSVPCWGERGLVLRGAAPRQGAPLSTLGARGGAFLASLRASSPNADVRAARDAVLARLGLPPRRSGHPLKPPGVYEEVASAAQIDAALLTEEPERAAAPQAWPPRGREAWALLQRFQLGAGSALPIDRALKADEAAGLWASLLMRLGGFEDVEGRIVGADAGTIALRTSKGRASYPLLAPAALFRGAADAWQPVSVLAATPGDRVRAWIRDGTVVGLALVSPAAAGTWERDSSWIHWTRRMTGRELAARLNERDPSRGVTNVTRVEVLSRGRSGRARSVRVTTDRGAVALNGLEVRFALALPESLFSVVQGRDAGESVFTFYGRGWGHGVGLCQTGAFGMALAGAGYREILGHYYPGATIGGDQGAPTPNSAEMPSRN